MSHKPYSAHCELSTFISLSYTVYSTVGSFEGRIYYDICVCRVNIICVYVYMCVCVCVCVCVCESSNCN